MFKTAGRATLAVLAIVVAASCHNDSNTVTGPLPAPTSTPAPGAPTSTPVPGVPTPTMTPVPVGQMATVQVGPGGSMSFFDQKSGSSTTTIHVGDTVQWVWVSGFHSTTSGTCAGACTPDGQWDSGSGSGMTFTHTFTRAGSFPYFCLVHQSAMQGMVVVQ